MQARRTLVRFAIALAVLACGRSASALDPALTISQYGHAAWNARDGFFAGGVNAITQTPDGFLWVGTGNGLFRFDGVSAIPWHPPSGRTSPALNVYSLLVARDGALWIASN